MLPFLKELTKEFKKVCNESYIEINTAEKVIYPYLTFSYSSESLENSREGFYIDIDMFDHCGANTVELEELTYKIKKHFESCKILNEEVLLQFKFISRRIIPTMSNQIKRRWIQLYVKVDWR